MMHHLALLCATVSVAMLSMAAKPAHSADSADSADSTSCAPSATVKLWGDPDDADVITALQMAYRAKAPAICIVPRLYGPESAIAGVYTGVADIAFMARELREPMERMAYEWVRLGKPTEIAFAHGGFQADRAGAQLAVIVHPQNPITSLALDQLDAMFGAEALRGARLIRTWGDAGAGAGAATRAGAKWADRAVVVAGTAIDDIPMLFVRRLVMKDSRKWNPNYRAFASDAEAVNWVARDPAAVAIVAAGAVDRRVRLLPLAAKQGAAAVLPTAASVADGSYPLARTLRLVVSQSDDKITPPATKAFVQFILSPEAQAIIARSKTHLPLGRDVALREAEKLK